MHDNPFGELPQGNPYAAPTRQVDHRGSANPLLVPAIFLLVLSLLFLLLLIASLPGQLMRFREIDTSTPEGVGELLGGIAAFVVWTVMTLAITAGSVCMIRLQGYTSAFAAAVLATIPVCSPCFVLGMPFGIWAIILLRRPEVKRRFT